MAIKTDGAVRRRDRRDVCDAPRLVRSLCNGLDTRLSRKLRAAFNDSRRHREILDLSVDPSDYKSVDLFYRDWLAVNLLSKFDSLNLGINTAEVAIENFYEGEAQCRLTNQRFKRKYDTPTTGVSAISLLEAARLKILELLGSFNWDDAAPFMGFSSGATTRKRRSQGDAYYKFQGQPEVTRRAALLACCAIESVPSWAEYIRAEFGLDPVNWVRVVSGSRITTVPKNAKTDRTIAMEPCMNMFLQRGIGGLIRRKLKRVGIDLDDQSLNQRLARQGSLSDSLATIDLKAASDTISTELVKYLLPDDWFLACDLIRSEQGTMPSGEIILFQKFSSMGNGFTFELESLIFWALSSAVVDLMPGTGHVVAVYGDDIIVPCAAAGWLVELLQYCGFTTNVQKSFFAGPFRESCGKHYFRGVDVTPFYIRKPIKSLSRRFWYCNSLRRWASRLTDGQIADSRYFPAYRDAVETIPSHAQRWIPEGFGDGGLIGTFSEAVPRMRNSMWEGRFLQEGSGRKIKVYDRFAYLRALMNGGVGDLLTDLLVDRNRTWYKWRTYRLSRWCDAPLWCDARA